MEASGVLPSLCLHPPLPLSLLLPLSLFLHLSLSRSLSVPFTHSLVLLVLRCSLCSCLSKAADIEAKPTQARERMDLDKTKKNIDLWRRRNVFALADLMLRWFILDTKKLQGGVRLNFGNRGQFQCDGRSVRFPLPPPPPLPFSGTGWSWFRLLGWACF